MRIEGKVLSRITEFLLSHGKSSAQRILFHIPIRLPDVIASPSLIPVHNIISSSHHFLWFDRYWNILTLSCPNLPLGVFVLSFSEMERGRGRFFHCATCDYETRMWRLPNSIAAHPSPRLHVCLLAWHLTEDKRRLRPAVCVKQEVEQERGKAKRDLNVTAATEVAAPSHIWSLIPA